MAMKASAEPINLESLYRLDDFQKLTGLGRSAMRTARRNGLKVRRTGGRAYVLGRDFIEYLDRIDEAENGGAA